MENNVGDLLKQARLAKGYTLDDLQQITKIQKRYLIALEENRPEQLPGEFYYKAFLKQYAEAVEMDSASFSRQPAVQVHTEEEQKEAFTAGSFSSRAEIRRSRKKIVLPFTDNIQMGIPTLLLFLLVMAIFAMIIFALLQKGNGTTETEPTIQYNRTPTISAEAESDAGTQDTGAESGASVASGSADPSEEIQIELTETASTTAAYTVSRLDLPQTITIKTSETGRSWIQVTSGSEVWFEGTIAASDAATVEIPEQADAFSVRVGYMPSTTLEIGGKEVPLPENRETVQTQTLEFTLEDE